MFALAGAHVFGQRVDFQCFVRLGRGKAGGRLGNEAIFRNFAPLIPHYKQIYMLYRGYSDCRRNLYQYGFF